MQSFSTPFRLQPSPISLPTHTNSVLLHTKPTRLHPYKKRISTKKLDKLAPHGAQSSTGGGDHDRPPLDTAFKLYSAFKNKNLQDLSELISNGSQSSNNLLPIIYALSGKKIMSQLLSSLMAFLRNHAEIVIRPESKGEGWPDVGIRWRIEWKGVSVPFGHDCSLNISHTYYGGMFLRNWRVMFEPLFLVEPLFQRFVEILMPTLEKIAPQLKGKGKAAFMYYVLSLISMAITLILWRNASM